MNGSWQAEFCGKVPKSLAPILMCFASFETGTRAARFCFREAQLEPINRHRHRRRFVRRDAPRCRIGHSVLQSLELDGRFRSRRDRRLMPVMQRASSILPSGSDWKHRTQACERRFLHDVLPRVKPGQRV
jgi:hypothetical protein